MSPGDVGVPGPRSPPSVCRWPRTILARSGSRSSERHAAIARIASHSAGRAAADATRAGATRVRALGWTVIRVVGSSASMASRPFTLTKLNWRWGPPSSVSSASIASGASIERRPQRAMCSLCRSVEALPTLPHHPQFMTLTGHGQCRSRKWA